MAAPALISGVPINSIARSAISYHMNEDSDRVLVLIQLNGGNDGLQAIIPIDQYDNLAQVRSNILIPEQEIIPVTNTIGFHPNMTGLKSLYDQGNLGIAQSVGYQNQNRSHFRSMDIWHTASNADQILDTGWVGRYLESLYTDYPSAYPNSDYPDPFAITVGNLVSETCQGSSGNFSMVISNPDNLSVLANPINNELAEGCYGNALDYLSKSIEQTNEYGDVIRSANDNGNNLSSKYDTENPLAEKLKIVARLISGGLKTKVFVVNLAGFDTHASQVMEGEPTMGVHAELLGLLSDAICAFQDDIKQLGLEKRVLGMTYSEFGRRIKSNFSFGTDHGDAAPLIVFGACVNPHIHGNNPIIDPLVEDKTGVAMEFDFRDIYGSVLMDWFEVEENRVKELLHENFEYIPILDLNCLDTVLAIDLFDFQVVKENTHAKLDWAASDSSNIEKFEIQHSLDTNKFIKIGEVKSAVGINGIKHYDFLHLDPHKGDNYYRIKEIEYNGGEDYSKIKHLNFELVEANVKIYPNPSEGDAYIDINTTEGSKIKVHILDELGRTAKRYTINESLSINKIQINNFQSGVYFVKVQINKTIITKKLTIL